MNLSKRGADLIYHFEGKLKPIGDDKFVAYRCPAGVWTIHAGVTNGVHEGMVVTEEQGEAMFRKEIASHETAVAQLVTVPLEQEHFDALVSFSYNVGQGNLKRSTLLRKLNRRDYDGAEEQFARWTKARVKGRMTILRGLVRRRKAEAAMFGDGTAKLLNHETEESAELTHMPQRVGERVQVPAKTIAVGTGTAAGATGTAIANNPPPKETWTQALDVINAVPAWATDNLLLIGGILGAIALLWLIPTQKSEGWK